MKGDAMADPLPVRALVEEARKYHDSARHNSRAWEQRFEQCHKLPCRLAVALLSLLAVREEEQALGAGGAKE